MEEQSKTTIKKCLERVELNNKPTLYLTEAFKRKVDYLHKQVGAKEWSGELITREEGVITDLDKWKIFAEDIFLVDIGTKAFTGYEVEKGSFKAADIIELYEQYPGLLDGTLKAHHIHSHNDFQTFFSGTDWENLEDRAGISNYFLMLIVNFKGPYCAKVAYKGIEKGNSGRELEFANNVDGLTSLKLGGKKDRDVLVVMDCKIEIETVEIEVDDVFKARWEAVIAQQKLEEEEAKKRKEKRSYGHMGGGTHGWRGNEQGTWKNGHFYPDAWSGGHYEQGMLGYGDEYGDGWSDMDLANDEEWGYEKGVWIKKKKGKKEKKISEMTEKEWNKSQQMESFDLRHAKAFLNSILYGTYMPSNFNDCIAKIEGDNKKLSKVTEVLQYIEDFEDMLQEHFDVIWPNGTVQQYSELLQEVYDYLLPYKYIRLVSEMIDVVEQEIKVNSAIL